MALGLPTEEGDVYADSSEWNELNMVLGTYPLTDPVWIVRFKEAMQAAFLLKTAKEWELIFMAYKVREHSGGGCLNVVDVVDVVDVVELDVVVFCCLVCVVGWSV